MRRPVEIVLLCVMLGACRHTPTAEAPEPASGPAGASATAPPVVADSSARTLVQEFRGSYTRGFEASWFVPCDAPANDALWWVTLTEEARLQRDSLLKSLSTPATGALAVRWRGTISPRMPAGQMGQGTRYILVTQVLEVRPLASREGCPFRSASKAFVRSPA